MKYGLSQENLQKIYSIFEKYTELEEVILYGSRAMGNFKNGSDIDLTFKGNALNLKIQNKIANDLDDLLLPYTFDLSIYKNLSHLDLIKHINEKGILFWKKKI